MHYKVTAFLPAPPKPEPNPQDKPVKPEMEIDPARVPVEAWFRHHDYEIYWTPEHKDSFFINSHEIKISDYFTVESDDITYGTLDKIHEVVDLVPRWPGATGTNTDIPVQVGDLFNMHCWFWQRKDELHRETFNEFPNSFFVNGIRFSNSDFEIVNGQLYAAHEQLEAIKSNVPIPFEPLTGRYYGQNLIAMVKHLNTPKTAISFHANHEDLNNRIQSLEAWKLKYEVEEIDTSAIDHFDNVEVINDRVAEQLFNGKFVYQPTPMEMFEILIRGEI
jgi:hypothetical protein